MTVNGNTGHAVNGGKKPTIMEVSEEAVRDWIDLCDKLVEGSLFKGTATLIFGNNVAGHKASINFYFEGLN